MKVEYVPIEPFGPLDPFGGGHTTAKIVSTDDPVFDEPQREGGLECRILDLIDAAETKIRNAKESGKADKIIYNEGKIEGILETWKTITAAGPRKEG